MSSKFVESFLVAGVGSELRLDKAKKTMLCGIKDVSLIRGDVILLKEKLINEGFETELKWTRFLTLSEEKKVFLAIRYSNPFQADDSDYALYDIELVRIPKAETDKKSNSTKGVLLHTIEAEGVNRYQDIFW